MMGQQQQQQQQTMAAAGSALRRMILVLAVAALVAAITMTTAQTAFAGPNLDSAAGKCNPPGLSFSNPELPTSGPNGLKVKQNCVPRH
jgi:hypothetical protein